MDTFNDQFPPGYYARATTDQGKTPLPFYVFDSEVMLEHFMMDYAIPGIELVPANVLLCWARSVGMQAHAGTCNTCVLHLYSHVHFTCIIGMCQLCNMCVCTTQYITVIIPLYI